MIMNAFDSSVKTFFLKNAGFVETLLSNRNKSFGSLNHNAGAYISKRSGQLEIHVYACFIVYNPS